MTCVHAPVEKVAPHGWPVRAVVVLLHGYQFLRGNRLSPCRFVPSCSNYAVEAMETHGILRGSWLTVCRIARCNPFGHYGFDPVPE